MSSSNGAYGQRLSRLWMTGFTLLAASVNIDAQSMSDKDSAQGRPTVYAWFPAHFGSWKTDGLQWDCFTHLCFRSVELTAEGKFRRVSRNLALGLARDGVIRTGGWT